MAVSAMCQYRAPGMVDIKRVIMATGPRLHRRNCEGRALAVATVDFNSGVERKVSLSVVAICRFHSCSMPWSSDYQAKH